MTPGGARAAGSAAGMVGGTISEETTSSRTRRAISWAYWAPKSTTRTVSCSTGPSVTHAHVLGPLEGLALRLESRGHHDLGHLELLQRLVAARGHRRAQRPEQVHAAVVVVGRADQDLLQRTPDGRADAGAARQRRVERGHAPVEALAG